MLLSKHNKLTNKTKVILSCDFAVSPNCKKVWSTNYRVCKKTRLNRGKDCCLKCAIKLSNSGQNNPAFKYPKNEKFFDLINSEIKAYLLGWVASDGSIRNRTLHVELHKQDISILEIFKTKISPNAPIVKRKNRDTCYLTISSKHMIESICRVLNVLPGNKQNKLRLPNLDSKYLKHFVRGFLDGDGWVSVKKVSNYKYLNCGIATIDPLLLKDFASYSENLKIPCFYGTKSIEWSGKNAKTFLNYLYEDSSFFLSRKKAVYDQWPFKFWKGNKYE